MMEKPFSRRVDLIAQTLCFLLVVMAAVFSISELAARDTTMNLMGGRAAALRAEYVERSSARLGMVPAAYYYRGASASASPLPAKAASQTSLNQATTEDVMKQEESLLNQILFIEDVRRDLQSLAAVGGFSTVQSLRGILEKYQVASRIASGAVTQRPATTTFSFLYDPLLLLSSGQLLAMAIMACGAIGALIAMLRSEHGMSGKVLVLGVAAGFVTYLAIKGGKHVFLLQAQGELVTFNPCGSAFAGLLAGLFTEKAYILISTITDEFIDRLKSATRPRSSDDGQDGKDRKQ